MLFQKSRRTRYVVAQRRRRKPQFVVEPLEGRALLTLIPVDFGATITGPTVAMNGALYFSANNGVNGNELWKSAGTAAGTRMLKDIHPGSLPSNPSYLTVVTNGTTSTLFFAATDGAHGTELWKSDGTA